VVTSRSGANLHRLTTIRNIGLYNGFKRQQKVTRYRDTQVSGTHRGANEQQANAQ
jgi:hypothetical protein